MWSHVTETAADKYDKIWFMNFYLIKFKNAGDQVIVIKLHMLRGEFLF